MRDTPPELNTLLFRLMMAREPGDRLRMGMEMTATAKALVRASLPENLSEAERRAAFLERFYGVSLDTRQLAPLMCAANARSENAMDPAVAAADDCC